MACLHAHAQTWIECAMNIDIVYDTVCPWCYIGKRRFEQALALRPHLSPTVRWQPFLLNPGIPEEGVDRTTYLNKKFGGEQRARSVYGAICTAGRSVDIDFAFERIARTANSVNSHRFVLHASENGKADSAIEALFFAYFVSGRDIGKVVELIEIGARLGLDATDLERYLTGDTDVRFVYEEHARAHKLGVNGVPSFVFDGRFVIAGAHGPAVLARILDVAAQESADRRADALSG